MKVLEHCVRWFSFQGADNENQPFLWMELRALRIFDTKEQVQEVMPKVFEVMTQVSGLKNDQMFILIAPMEPFYIGLEGQVFPWANVKSLTLVQTTFFAPTIQLWEKRTFGEFYFF